MVKIGVTLHPSDSPDREELDRLAAQIVEGVQLAGGEAILIPPDLDEARLRLRFSELDGLLLSGGGDVDPRLYGEAPTAVVSGVNANRDRTEMTLARWALAEGKSLFGICRGLQLLNVACGGSLYQDVSQHEQALKHAYYPDFPHDHLAHPVTVADDSRLVSILGAAHVQVNSLHHQACRVVAPGVRAVAWAPDGIVEALEVEGHPFAVAVQWHPEALLQRAESRALFAALVEASARR